MTRFAAGMALVAMVAVQVLATAAASAGNIGYDVTKHYGGAGTQAFDQYQPGAGETVTAITIELTYPLFVWEQGLDNETDVDFEIHIQFQPRHITLSSADVTFTPIDHQEGEVFVHMALPPHDNPDGIDTPDAFEADSGVDWVPGGIVGPKSLSVTASGAAEIATFMGTGTFGMDYGDDGTAVVAPSPVPGVLSTSTGPPFLYDAWVRITMESEVSGDPDVVPEPATLGLMALGGIGLLRRRRRK